MKERRDRRIQWHIWRPYLFVYQNTKEGSNERSTIVVKEPANEKLW